MPQYSVRHCIEWFHTEETKLAHLYEERITLWSTESIHRAIEQAESKAQRYCEQNHHKAVLDLFQAYWLPKEVPEILNGHEVFSLLRDSDLEPDDYLDAHFDTEYEHQTENDVLNELDDNA